MNKRSFVFLTNQYLPKPGATGLCVHRVAQELAQRGHEVDVICYGVHNLDSSEIDGIHILRVKIPFCLADVSNKSFLVRKAARIFSLFAKLIHLSNYPLRSSALRRRYAVTLESVLKKRPDSIVVSTFTPLEACAAVLDVKLKRPNIKTVYYSTDSLSNEKGTSGYISLEKRAALGLRWENRIFEFFDKLLIMECHKEYYSTNYFSPYFEKYFIANFPLLQPTKRFCNIDSHKCKKLVYAGTLYRNLRNPQYMCELLYNVNQFVEIDVSFMGGGDCIEIVKSYVDKTSGAIHHDGMVTHDEVSDRLADADILLSIGNLESPMAPSKIYEYMATCKPIIHIYSWDEDPSLEPLRKYGNCLIIKEGEAFPINETVDFLRNSKTANIDDVLDTFITSSPGYTANFLETL